MVSSASSVSAALREPWRAKPPREGVPPAPAGAAVPVAAPAAELVVLGAADADDTVDDWETLTILNWLSCSDR